MAEKPVMHGRDHRRGGMDPIGFAYNDWVVADTAMGTVTSGGATVSAGFSSITYQTDDGSIYGVGTGGTYDTIDMLVVGTFLIRARATFPQNRSGTVQVSAVIAGDVTTYDYNTGAGGIHFTDISPGEAIWEQLCVVNDLSAVAGAYISFAQTTGSDMTGVVGHLQIFRYT